MRMTIKKTLLTLSPLLLGVTAISANANNLSSTDGGLGVYDSGINATWTSDANLLGTWEAADPSIISTIVTTEAAAINTAYGFSLSVNDFGTGGTVDYWAAQAYVGYLNKIDYSNSTQWALPTTPDNHSSYGYNQTTSQLAELYTTELGLGPGGVFGDYSYGQANVGPFANVQASAYWSGTKYAPLPGYAWVFDTTSGFQTNDNKGNQYSAWAVSPGQVNAVPLPSAVWLFGSALVGLIGFNRRKLN